MRAQEYLRKVELRPIVAKKHKEQSAEILLSLLRTITFFCYFFLNEIIQLSEIWNMKTQLFTLMFFKNVI